ncbi:DUF1573 domain-containing protein [Terrimonas rubra]|uniref:DUF1573 domain-containing protein n=1 Tax=Terrimonas rubra TaxID=1035890 RepID=A0ABW6A365_9BACT
MKKILLASALLLSFGVFAQTKADDFIKVNKETHDFGKVKHNEPATYYFEITNTSDKPVVIANATASCGCTIPEKPKAPILPGKTDKVKVVYNSASIGPINRDITITLAGVQIPKVVHIKGEVLSADAYAAYEKEKGKTSKVN